MTEKKSNIKFLCSTAPWISADITEEEYKSWINSIKRSKIEKK